VNDAQDPATALSAVRQLVNQYQVFAIVPDLSPVNPGNYLKSQQILYVGGGFDYTYCSTSVTTSLWGYSVGGCLVPSNPPVMSDTYHELHTYVTTKTGSAHPTFALFSNDDASGANSVKLNTVSAKGAGFNVVYAKANVPVSASDYTPYVQQLLTSNNGKQPQAIACQEAAQCIPMWTALKNAGFTGTYSTPLGAVAALGSAMEGTVTTSTFNNEPSPQLTGLENALNAVVPGTQLTGYSNVPSYFATDMFATAVHTVQAEKKAITPANVRKVLSTMKWSIPGLVGPIQYPASSVTGTPYCTELLAYTGGTTHMVYPYTCSYKVFKVTAQAERVG
jgi:ABC-type branched-subunit amino acid transport system substrate-binding protein